MKRVLLILLTFAITASLSAVDKKVDAKQLKSAKKVQFKKAELSDEPVLNPDAVIYNGKVSAAALPGEKIGETAYNYQTNDNMNDRLIWDKASNTIHATWMYGDIAEAATGFPGRNMYYNFYQNGKWTDNVGMPIANRKLRAGYGAMQTDKNNVAIPVFHYTVQNIASLYYDFAPGFGFFTESIIWDGDIDRDVTVHAAWPDIAVDDADVWHVSAINNNQDDGVTEINDVNKNILYFRSTNRGQTWSEWIALFPDTTTFPLYSGTTGSQQIESANDGSGKLAVLVGQNSWDLYLFESNNRGATFNDPIQIIGNPFPDDADSLSFPFRWDVVVDFDSTTMAPVDTFLYPFTYEEDDAGLNAPRNNIRPAVAAYESADLMYHKGQPHVAWNEGFWIGDAGFYYPNGYGYTWTTPYRKFLNGESSHQEGGFAIKHWSPSTGVSTVFVKDDVIDVWVGNFCHYVTTPQLCVDEAGNLYCLFIKHSDSDTLRPEDGIEQVDVDNGPLSFGNIWGAKSTDGGKTWGDAVPLIAEDVATHQGMRYISVSNKNPNNVIHLMWLNAPGVPGTAITGDSKDHNTQVTAEMRYWAVPTSIFPATKTNYFGPDIELVTETTMGGFDFGDIGEAGQASKTLTVKNRGDQALVVTNAFAGASAFSVEPASFTVPAGGSLDVSILFRPKVETPYDTYIALPNNDPNEANVGFPVAGIGVPDLTAVDDQPAQTPSEYTLAQNYPNPFNPATAIQFSIAQEGQVKLVIYNTLGKEVQVLVNRNMPAGVHKAEWKAENLPSGVYFYRLTAGSFSATKKMILMQ